MDFKAQREREEKARAKSEARALEQCSYFGRFGSCLRTGVECPYAHDVTKVSVCQRFLHNECDDGEFCLLSHELIPQRMPVCRLFVAGLCISSACPFSHVNLGKDAELCKTFSRVGYCEEGDACSARHELTCYAWRTKGEICAKRTLLHDHHGDHSPSRQFPSRRSMLAVGIAHTHVFRMLAEILMNSVRFVEPVTSSLVRER